MPSSFIYELVLPAYGVHKKEGSSPLRDRPFSLSFPFCSLWPLFPLRLFLVAFDYTNTRQYVIGTRLNWGRLAKVGPRPAKHAAVLLYLCRACVHTKAPPQVRSTGTSGMPAMELPITQRTSSDLCLSGPGKARPFWGGLWGSCPSLRCRARCLLGQGSRSCTLPGPLKHFLLASGALSLYVIAGHSTGRAP